MIRAERIDHLEARGLAPGIALALLLRAATPETRASIAKASERATDLGTAYELTDQIVQLRGPSGDRR
jgi:hypothetical protein